MKTTILLFTAFLLAVGSFAAEPPNVAQRGIFNFSDETNCLKISDKKFFLLKKGPVSIYQLKKSPRLIMVSYLAVPNYKPAIGQIELVTIREHSKELAERYFQKAKRGVQAMEKSNSETKVLKISDQNIFCFSRYKLIGLEDADSVSCYLNTDTGTHTFSMSLKGNLSLEAERVIAKSFQEMPCPNVFDIGQLNKK